MRAALTALGLLLALPLSACLEKDVDYDDDDDDGGPPGPDGGAGDGGASDGGAESVTDGGAGDGGSGDGGSGDGGSGDGGSGDGGSGDGGSGDGGSGDGGSGDGGSGDGGATTWEPLVPTSMMLDWNDAILDGGHGTVRYSGSELPSEIWFVLADDAWDSDWDDLEHYCLVAWDTADAETGDCEPCYAGLAWSVDTRARPTLTGNCASLDPEEWGETVSDYFFGIDLVYGYGPDSEGLVEEYLAIYEDHTGWNSSNLWGAYVVSDALGLGTTQWGVAYGYAADSAGELDDSAWMTCSAEGLDNGWAVSLAGYYWPL